MRTRQVVSISLGSSGRNAGGLLDLGGEKIELSRIGTDGDRKKAASLFSFYDGKVDAMGLGGTDLYLFAGQRRYVFKESEKIIAGAKNTPVLDGSGLKNTLEKLAVRYLAEKGIIDFAGKKALMVCAVDRPGMAGALSLAGCSMVIGDLIFGLGIDYPIRSLGLLEKLARIAVPVVTRLPIDWMYPTGSSQGKKVTGREKYFLDSDIIAGDFHFIRRFMPDKMEGKTVITNTVTQKDRQMLKEAGVKLLVTTTPKIGGRSYGTNVMEAALVAATGAKKALDAAEYERLIGSYGLVPDIEDL